MYRRFSLVGLGPYKLGCVEDLEHVESTLCLRSGRTVDLIVDDGASILDVSREAQLALDRGLLSRESASRPREILDFDEECLH